MTLIVVPLTSPVSLKARRAALRMELLRASAVSRRVRGGSLTALRVRVCGLGMTHSSLRNKLLVANWRQDYGSQAVQRGNDPPGRPTVGAGGAGPSGPMRTGVSDHFLRVLHSPDGSRPLRTAAD